MHTSSSVRSAGTVDTASTTSYSAYLLISKTKLSVIPSRLAQNAQRYEPIQPLSFAFKEDGLLYPEGNGNKPESLAYAGSEFMGGKRAGHDVHGAQMLVHIEYMYTQVGHG